MTNIIRTPCDEGIVQSGAPGEPCSERVGRWVLAATILGSSMAFIDATVINVALPSIQRDLDANVVGAQWIVESYALFLAALILVGGSLGDHYGRRRAFSIGVILFTGASVWCGLAPSTEQLIAARAVQGVGGALLVPGSLALISAVFAKEQRGKAIGTWAGFTGITSLIGPVFGGFMIDTLSWRWVFFINVPLAVAVLVMSARYVPESRDPAARRLDPWGALLATGGLGALVYGLIESSTRGLADPVVLSAVTGGVAALAAFVALERWIPEPMMPLSVFRSRDFSAANAFTLIFYFALGGSLFFFPFLLIQVQGYTATAAGAAFAPAILLMFFLSRVTGGFVDRFGARLPLVVGSSIGALGFALFARPGIGGSYWTTYFPAATVLGLGLATLVPALTTVALNSIRGQQSGLASGINNAVSRVGALLAIAVLGIVMVTSFGAALDRRIDALDISSAARAQLQDQRVELAAAAPPKSLGVKARSRVQVAIDEAFLTGFRVVMLIASGLAVAAAISAAMLMSGRSLPLKARESPRRGSEASPSQAGG